MKTTDTNLPDSPASATTHPPGTESSAETLPVFRTSELRKDAKTAEIVEKAVQIQESLGTMAAATYLKANDVDFDVTFRVLNRPWQRRKNAE